MDANEHKGIWLIDPVHTKIRFEVKYLQITSVSGWFTEFEGKVITSSDNFSNSKIFFTIYSSSIYTGNTERDNHLRSGDFFDVEKYPILTFKSTSVHHVQGDKLKVVGDLQIKDKTRTIDYEAIYTGSSHDPMGNLKAGLGLKMVLNRKDFNVSWNQVFEETAFLLSEEVNVFCDVQLLKVS